MALKLGTRNEEGMVHAPNTSSRLDSKGAQQGVSDHCVEAVGERRCEQIQLHPLQAGVMHADSTKAGHQELRRG